MKSKIEVVRRNRWLPVSNTLTFRCRQPETLKFRLRKGKLELKVAQ